MPPIPNRLDLEDFLKLARERHLASDEDLEAFAASWRAGFEAGEPGFGDETTWEDWAGGLDAWQRLQILVQAARRAGWRPPR